MRLLFLFMLMLLLNNQVFSKVKKEYKYKTFFGSCPSRSAGNLTIELMSEFERSKSLRKMKNKIASDKLDQKNFVSKYRINLDPFKKQLTFSYDCPEPLLKVEVFEKKGNGSYTAILVGNGELVDPTYEVLLRQEKKLKRALPHLAIPVGEIDNGLQKTIANLFRTFDTKLTNSLSEVIVSEDLKMTLIFSFSGRPSSVFMGSTEWDTKMVKLTKTLRYLTKRKKIPSIINLTNSKKIVVKFNDKF